jgi:serine/threonine protein phosphatase PrpC
MAQDRDSMSVIESVGVSHIGMTREDNQDAIRLSRPDVGLAAQRGELYAVADGMGGYAHGGVASALALEKLFDVFYTEMAGPSTLALRRGVEAANLAVYQTAQRLGAGRMGTTLTAVNIRERRLYLAHVGDSRAYLIRDGCATCLTADHTRVGELVRMRVLSANKVRSHAQRSILTKCLGLELFVQPDLSELALREDDRLVLCSDGVWSVVQDDEFAQYAHAAAGAEAYGQRLIELALERRSDDNVSVVVIHLHALAPASAGRRGWPGFLMRLKRAYGRSGEL